MATSSGAPLNAELLKASKIIPDVIDEVGERFLDLRVLYRDHIEVSSGVAMRVQQTHQKPRVEMRGYPFGSEDLYTIIMVDPDAPTPKDPAFRCYLHWLVVNIPGETPPTTEIWDTGKEVVPYVGPDPPLGSHRYAFLLFKQGEIKVEPVEERKFFNVKDFVKQHELSPPMGGSYFYAMKDDQLEHTGNQSPFITPNLPG
ncbi:uncharacterized protein LOC131068785 isoform X2 [Cryptomeria japonica]|uniref:uncharacterized protein LOC131068785 isoform X2 n=1 Tax=Cryptomeria japonica TaxID=3369 RepID=UPI0027DA21B2|nr:uncharacterized protein LOC131068785 isoform X2 [Cryptomeria japonica]